MSPSYGRSANPFAARVWEDEVYCDADWPCTAGLTCQDNVCYDKEDKNNAQKLRRQRNRAFLVIGCIFAGLVLVGLGLGLWRFAGKKAKLERQRAFIVRDQIEDAICSVEDFQAPFAYVSRVITIILSRRPIVLSTFLSSGYKFI